MGEEPHVPSPQPDGAAWPVRKDACDARYPEIALTEQGRKAITACAPAHAAWVRELFVDVLGPDRLALLGEASNDVVHAIAEHQKASCPPEVRRYC